MSLCRLFKQCTNTDLISIAESITLNNIKEVCLIVNLLYSLRFSLL